MASAIDKAAADLEDEAAAVRRAAPPPRANATRLVRAEAMLPSLAGLSTGADSENILEHTYKTREFFQAVRTGDIEIVQSAIRQGILTREQPARHEQNVAVAALVSACNHRNIDTVELLLDAGTDVNTASKANWTPLVMASGRNEPKIVRMLLDAGADVDLAVKNGKTALQMASGSALDHNAVIVRMLLDEGADIDKVGKHGFTALNFASYLGIPSSCACCSTRARTSAFVAVSKGIRHSCTQKCTSRRSTQASLPCLKIHIAFACGVFTFKLLY